MHRTTRVALTGAALISTAALALAGCATGGSPAPTDGGSTATTVTYLNTADGTCAAEPNADVNFAEAKEVIERFQQQASSIWTDEPLPEPVAPGTKVVFANNDTPVAQLWLPFFEDAITSVGAEFVNASVGTSAESQQAGFNSIIAMAPDAVIMAAIDPTFVEDQIRTLEDNGAVVVASSQPGVADFGLDDSFGGTASSIVNGRVLAAGAVYFTCGTGDQFVFYNSPELGFSGVQMTAAQEYLAELAPNATLRTVDISVADAAPQDKIVSDLQAHPETQFFITPLDQYQIGLAAAADLVGIENDRGFGQSSLPPNYEQIANDEQTAGFGIDFEAYVFGQVDEAFRKLQGVFKPYGSWEDIYQTLSRVIVKANVEDYPGGVFEAYDNIRGDYLKLWAGQ
ncbi:MAG TPA: substrate-binding domain-containing protein [Microbacteriaceae bacterium]|nr:substrate-binding domain-containing protein [Microbacteriaceae bacterium]